MSEAAGLPIIVPIGETPMPLSELLDERGAVIPAARRAAGPGVLFDVGHGRGSFACSVAGQALGFGVLTLIGESSQW